MAVFTVKSGGGGDGTDSVARQGVAENQSLLSDSMNASQAELDALEQKVNENQDKQIKSIERQPDQSILVTYEDNTTSSVEKAVNATGISIYDLDGGNTYSDAGAIGFTGGFKVTDEGGSDITIHAPASVHQWDENKEYDINDVVFLSGKIYYSKTGLNTENPETSIGTDWELVGGKTEDKLDKIDLWSNTEIYGSSDVAMYGSNIYVSVIDNNTNNTPGSDNGSIWLPVGASYSDEYSIDQDQFAGYQGTWSDYTNYLPLSGNEILLMSDAGVFDFNQDGNPITVNPGDRIINLYDKWTLLPTRFSTDDEIASWNSHISDNDIHVTQVEKNEWSSKQDALPSGNGKYFRRNETTGDIEAVDLDISTANLIAIVGTPQSTDGEDGYYAHQIDAALGENDIWGPKVNGAWPAQADFKSADPEEGSLSDIGDPIEGDIAKAWSANNLQKISEPDYRLPQVYDENRISDFGSSNGKSRLAISLLDGKLYQAVDSVITSTEDPSESDQWEPIESLGSDYINVLAANEYLEENNSYILNDNNVRLRTPTEDGKFIKVLNNNPKGGRRVSVIGPISDLTLETEVPSVSVEPAAESLFVSKNGRYIKLKDSSDYIFLKDINAVPGTEYDLSDIVKSNNELWVKHTGGENADITFITTDPNTIIRIRKYGEAWTQVSPNTPVTLNGSFWRVARAADTIEIFDFSTKGEVSSESTYMTASDASDVNVGANTNYYIDINPNESNNINKTGNVYFPQNANGKNTFLVNAGIGCWNTSGNQAWTSISIEVVDGSGAKLRDAAIQTGRTIEVDGTAEKSGNGLSCFAATKLNNGEGFRVRFNASQNHQIRSRNITITQAFSDGTYVSKDRVIEAEDRDVTLIDVDASNGALYQFSTGETWSEIVQNYERLVFTGNASRNGTSQIRPWSFILDLGSQLNAFTQAGYRIDLTNDYSVTIYTDIPTAGSTGLVYRQSGGDAPTSGRMQFKVVGVKASKTVSSIDTNSVVIEEDLDAGWRIVGDYLECWGEVQQVGSIAPIDISFPKNFGAPPKNVNLTPQWNYNASTNGTFNNVSPQLDGAPGTSSCRIRVFGGNALDTVRWSAKGRKE